MLEILSANRDLGLLIKEEVKMLSQVELSRLPSYQGVDKCGNYIKTVTPAFAGVTGCFSTPCYNLGQEQGMLGNMFISH